MSVRPGGGGGAQNRRGVRARRIEGAPAGLTAELVIDPAPHGSNGKVDNLINLSRRIAGEVVVLADSDIIVAPDYLNRLTAALERPASARDLPLSRRRA